MRCEVLSGRAGMAGRRLSAGWRLEAPSGAPVWRWCVGREGTAAGTALERVEIILGGGVFKRSQPDACFCPPTSLYPACEHRLHRRLTPRIPQGCGAWHAPRLAGVNGMCHYSVHLQLCQRGSSARARPRAPVRLARMAGLRSDPGVAVSVCEGAGAHAGAPVVAAPGVLGPVARAHTSRILKLIHPWIHWPTSQTQRACGQWCLAHSWDLARSMGRVLLCRGAHRLESSLTSRGGIRP